MNESIPETIFSAIPMAPRDPILGITEAFHADPNPHKINLGVGVYYDDNGKVPLLKCVLEAERQMTAQGSPHTYLPIDGLAMYDSAVQNWFSVKIISPCKKNVLRLFNLSAEPGP